MGKSKESFKDKNPANRSIRLRQSPILKKSTAPNGRGRAINGMRGTSFAEKIQKGMMTRGKDNGVFLRSPSFESSDMKEEIEY
jgi:hypothetical protein